MTIARAIIRPGKWSARKDTWPVLDLTYVQPINGAYFDWAADQLPEGQLTEWPALNTNAPFIADGAAPQVVISGGAKAVRFDGTSSRMRVLTPGVPAPHTVVSVFRLLSPEKADAPIFGYNNGQGGTISVANDATMSFYGYVNNSYLMPSPVAPADTNWHVAILTSDGTNSAFRIDEQERTGPVTSDIRQGITLGFQNIAGGDNRTKIEYRRNIVLPPLNATERAALYSKLKTAYNI